MKKTIYVLGIGHNSPECIELAIHCGYEVVGLYHYNDTRTNESVHGYKILGSFDDMFQSGIVEGNNFMLSMGDNQIRASLCKRIIEAGGVVPTLIHPTAVVSRFANISDVGVHISPFVHVMSDVEIDDNTMILTQAIIAHTTKIGKNCLISLNASIGAYTVVEDFVFVGMGALAISGKVNLIGHHAIIGANSLLTHEVPAYAIMVGSPARQTGENIQ